MTLKKFRATTLLLAFVLAVIVSQAVVLRNYYLAVAGVLAVVGLKLLMLKRVPKNEAQPDERDLLIAGKAARYVFTAGSILMSAVVFVLMVNRDVNPMFAQVGNVLAFFVCAQLLAYAIVFYVLRVWPKGYEK